MLAPERAVPSRVPSGGGCHEGRGFGAWSPPQVGGGVLAPERAVPFRVPSGWPGDMGAVSGGSLDHVHGVAKVRTFSFLPEAVLECVGASVPFGCPRSVPLVLWEVFVAPLVAGLAPAAGTAPKVMRPFPSVTSVGARRDPCNPVPSVMFTGPTSLDSCVVPSGVFMSAA